MVRSPLQPTWDITISKQNKHRSLKTKIEFKSGWTKKERIAMGGWKGSLVGIIEGMCACGREAIMEMHVKDEKKAN